MPCSHCREERIFARGLCGGCYHRLRRSGSVARKNVRNIGLVCSVAGCEREAHAKGFCFVHYDKQQHPLRNTWKLIRSRYPNDVPKRWDKFEVFLSEVGERPGPRHQLRRISENKSYSAANVHWIEPVVIKQSGTKKSRAIYSREWALSRKYKITSDDYQQMLNEQSGVCAICAKSDKLHVDHCHATKVVRGLLCVRCNRMLGDAVDNPEFLRRAIAYLERSRSK